MPIELILGLFTLCGVLISSIITLASNRNNISSTQTVETMKVQKTLIDTLFSENQVLSQRMDEVEESIRAEREEFQKELIRTREAYNQLKHVVEEAVSLLKSDKHLEALELLEK